MLVRNSRREFLASHPAAREMLHAEACDVAVSPSGDSEVSREEADSEASCKERGLPGMVLSTIPGKTQKLPVLLCGFCELCVRCSFFPLRLSGL